MLSKFYFILFCFTTLSGIVFVNGSQQKLSDFSSQEQERPCHPNDSSDIWTENSNDKFQIQKEFEDWIRKMKNKTLEFATYREDQISSTIHWIHSCLDENFGKKFQFCHHIKTDRGANMVNDKLMKKKMISLKFAIVFQILIIVSFKK
jgi:hypothetical protein